MGRRQLDAYDESEPIWGFVAQLREEAFTGRADVGTSPRVRVYATDGRVYFAERDGDAAVESRLVSAGVLTADQIERGGIRLADGMSLARLFQLDHGVDRDAVESALDLMTTQTLEAAAMEPAGQVALYPQHHHPSGVHQWVAADAPGPVSLPTLGAWSPPADQHRTAPEAQPAHQYASAGSGTVNLPRLASRPMSVGEIAAAQAVALPTAHGAPARAAVEELDLATLVQRVTDDQLLDVPIDDLPHREAPLVPTLPSSPAIAPAAGHALPPPVAGGLRPLAVTPPAALITSTFAQILKTPPATPAVTATEGPGSGGIESLLAVPAARPAHEVPFTTGAWESPPAGHATVDEIWNMVDELLALDHHEQQLTSVGAQGDRRSRGRRRNKKD